ncbi:MAG: tRNA(Met) cytidine acetyltransferase TmcA domain-containing protein, partial [Thermoprotei archaeon]
MVTTRERLLDMSFSKEARILEVGPRRSQRASSPRIECTGFGNYHRLLGSTFDAVVYDATRWYTGNSLTACAGLIRGGGILVMLVSPNELPRHFSLQERGLAGVALSRYIDAVKHGGLVYIEAGWPRYWRAEPEPVFRRAQGERFATPDQEKAYHLIENFLSGVHGRVLILRSKRGRGKSTCLGMVLADRLAEGAGHAYVLSPESARLQILETLSRELLKRGVSYSAHGEPARIEVGRAAVTFVSSPGENMAGETVVVDEAAGFDMSSLLLLARAAKKIVVST